LECRAHSGASRVRSDKHAEELSDEMKKLDLALRPRSWSSSSAIAGKDSSMTRHGKMPFAARRAPIPGLPPPSSWMITRRLKALLRLGILRLCSL
jgi:hypothetical protein